MTEVVGLIPSERIWRRAMMREDALRRMRLQREHEGHSPHMLLLCADIVAALVDDLVRNGIIDARSRLADARLNYGQPFSSDIVDAIACKVEPEQDPKADQDCDCCERKGEYNGYGSGPLLFVCPQHCPCHD